MAEGWVATRKALTYGQFFTLIEGVISDPSILSTCRHEFCRQCLQNSGTCPKCGSPYWKKDIQTFTALQSLVLHLKTLEDIINVGPSPKNALLLTPARAPTIETTPILETTPTTATSIESTPTILTALRPVNYRWAPSKRGRSDDKVSDNKRNARGETRLQVAVIKGNYIKVKELLEGGADPNVTDNAGWTPLHEACNHGYEDIVELLISYGSLLNVPADNNDTPLHDAVMNNHTRIATILVENGANTSLRNSEGYTPLDLARQRDMIDALSVVPLVLSSPIIDTANDTLILLGSGLKPHNKSLMSKTSERLGRCVVVNEFNAKVTHVLTESNEKGCCTRTMKCLSAVAKGAWLLQSEWLRASSKEGHWIKEEDYVIKGFHYEGKSWLTGAPLKSHNNAIEKCPGLFNGLEFYIDTHLVPPQPTRTELKSLIELAGGKVLLREPTPSENEKKFPFHASNTSPQLFSICSKIIITSKPGINQLSLSASLKGSTHVVYTTVSWVLDCLSQFKLIEYY
uniref:BRCT domain-containing protein n=1 Tax=Amphimedon queenslandica TaxID=400682 RepID=A0A1X7VV49_AMPQE